MFAYFTPRFITSLRILLHLSALFTLIFARRVLLGRIAENLKLTKVSLFVSCLPDCGINWIKQEILNILGSPGQSPDHKPNEMQVHAPKHDKTKTMQDLKVLCRPRSFQGLCLNECILETCL